jgi:FSR family fosmidomycin resistance protein-like MFS transporter
LHRALVFTIKNAQFKEPLQKSNSHDEVDDRHKHGDAWGPFGILSLAVMSRSIVFFGLNTFLPLYWINVLHQSKAAGARALAIFFTSGVIGTLLGGWLADRVGYSRIVITFLACLAIILPVLMSFFS